MVRRASFEDIERILELVFKCFPRTPRSYFEHYIPDRDFPDLSLVAEENGEIVGYVQIYDRTVRTTQGNLRVGGIGNVCVSRKHRGKGIGSKLLQTATDLMKEKGFNASLLFASKREFYEKNGWRVWESYWCSFEVPEAGEWSEGDFRDVMLLSEKFNEGWPMTVVRDEYVWEFQMKYGDRKLMVSPSKDAYAILSRSDGVYELIDAAFENAEELFRILPAGVHRLHALPSHTLCEGISRFVPVRYQPYNETFLKPLDISWTDLEILIPKNRWHFWIFDMF